MDLFPSSATIRLLLKALVNRWRGGFQVCRGRATAGAVSIETEAPVALATGASIDGDPKDSGLMMPGSPHDRNVRTHDRFEPWVHVHAHVDQGSNSAWFEPGCT